MTGTLANGYSSESTHWELSKEYQHDRVYIVSKNICVLALLTKSSLSIERVKQIRFSNSSINSSMDNTCQFLYQKQGILETMSPIPNKEWIPTHMRITAKETGILGNKNLASNKNLCILSLWTKASASERFAHNFYWHKSLIKHLSHSISLTVGLESITSNTWRPSLTSSWIYKSWLDYLVPLDAITPKPRKLIASKPSSS